MIAKINTPLNLGSPTLAATTASLRNRLPTQMRRCIPLYVGCVVLVLFIFNMSLFRSSQHHTMLQPPLAAGKQAVPATGAAAVVPIGNAPATAVPAGTVRENFPRKIWQSWKVNPLQFERKHADVARSWAEKNPEYRYEVLTDGNQMQYVEEHFGPLGFNRPDIVNFFRDLKDAIVKADLLRYLIMYAEGGLWADIDVEAMKPMQKFIPPRYDVKDIDMVVGVEIDEPDWKDHPILGPKSRSFCQWTFMCKPQQPVMMRLIEHIMTWLTEVAANQTATISDVHLDFDQIISGTGPSAFTEAIMTEMNILAEKNGETKKIEWDDFHDISESKVVSRVLVLTVEAFAAGQGHSESGTHDSKTALVRHHYHASNWPGAHPRYNHPAYGEVEKCNWKDDCVRKWDEDVAAFNKMTPEEQAVVVGEKERERQEQKEKEEREKKEREEEDRRREQEKKDKEMEELKRKWREEEAEAAKKASEAAAKAAGAKAEGTLTAEEPKKEEGKTDGEKKP